MRKLNVEEMDLVAGAGEHTCTKNCPPTKNEHCNNGWGNGEDCAPGNSLAHQPKFEDLDTGPTPSNSPASGGGNR